MQFRQVMKIGMGHQYAARPARMEAASVEIGVGDQSVDAGNLFKEREEFGLTKLGDNGFK